MEETHFPHFYQSIIEMGLTPAVDVNLWKTMRTSNFAIMDF